MNDVNTLQLVDKQVASAAYYLDLFSADTLEAFNRSGLYITGFRKSQEAIARKIREGDKFLCYLVGLGRWCGVLKVEAPYFVDDTPLFFPQDDPYIVRFKTKPLIWLPKEKAVPIRSELLWQHLSFTRDCKDNRWAGKLRNSLNRLSETDGVRIEEVLNQQKKLGQVYPVDEKRYRKLMSQRVQRPDGAVTVTVPEDEERPAHTRRESQDMQALLAEVGATMGFNVWVPLRDRAAVLQQWKPKEKELMESLPLNYDAVTLRTVEMIDVLWFKKRAIVRAFEVEHTTSIYSGILRMVDLLALQPNMLIKLHIVAPKERRDKVFQEILRPVFSLLDKAPLSEICTFLSYESCRMLSRQRHLKCMTDAVLDEISEQARVD